MNKLRFIKTNSEETANKLRSLGFQEIPNADEDFYTFINNVKFVFAKEDRVFYTNILHG